MSTTETVYYYAVTYTAGQTSFTISGTGTQISVTTPNAIITNADTNDVDDTTKGIENKYIGSVVVDGVKGYLVQDTSNSKYYVFLVSKPASTSGTQTVDPSTNNSDTNKANWNATAGNDAACFMAGTLVRTPQGEVAVETLKTGDLVSLADGGEAPVSWMGRHTVSTHFADKLRVLPIRIKANALDDGVPARDLLLSPDHALLVDGVLIQAGALVNGVTITRETQVPETFTYYHVETASHALILAENTPAETFVDNVDRFRFDNWEEHQTLDGDAAGIPEMDHPRAKSARQVPQKTRTRLAARLNEAAAAA